MDIHNLTIRNLRGKALDWWGKLPHRYKRDRLRYNNPTGAQLITKRGDPISSSDIERIFIDWLEN